MRKLTTEEFIEKSIKKHGNKYDYSLVKYDGSSTKIKIICPIHGVFEQKSKYHLSGSGCIKCGIDLKRSSSFIEKAKQIHGDKYDYSLVDYKNNITKVKIICSIHGIFEQTPKSHSIGRGCPSCSGNKKLTTKEFIEKAKNLHKDKYDYYLVEYKNTTTKVKIICHKHGKCRLSKGELLIEKYLKDSGIQFEQQKKFSECRNKLPLPFDFYLPNKNMCIEYDGKQHFESVKYWGGEEGLKSRQENDRIKTDYCGDNGIELLRIKYNDNTLEILEFKFNI